MGSVITISRQYGSDGRTVGLKAAEALGYLYLDKELLVEISRQANVPMAVVEKFDEAPGNSAVRLLKMLLVPDYAAVAAVGYPIWSPYGVFPDTAPGESEAPLHEDGYVQLMRQVLHRLAAERDLVVVGHGGREIFADWPFALHVRVVAGEKFRLETAMRRDGLSQEQARLDLVRVDDLRRRYYRRHFGSDWEQPDQYHLVLNTGLIGIEAAARYLVEAHDTL